MRKTEALGSKKQTSLWLKMGFARLGMFIALCQNVVKSAVHQAVVKGTDHPRFLALKCCIILDLLLILMIIK